MKTTIKSAVGMLVASASERGRNLQMPGDPHYQPALLKPYLGYDQRAGWLILVEWFWMVTLAKSGVMPKSHAKLLTEELLRTLLREITMTKVTRLERKKTNHDILALLALMKKILTKDLHRWLHLGLTSYDTICTAYALQAKHAFTGVFVDKLIAIDALWRRKISETANLLMIGRTHLQDALPITVGAWLSVLHSRFVSTARHARTLAFDIPGKFSGAVGTGAAIKALSGVENLEAKALSELDLPSPSLSTQIVQPEGLERFFNEIVLLSSALANLGDDVRHLQASAIREIRSASSTSSTMSHKDANPIFAEQADGMHVSVRTAFYNVVETLNSTLQRDLRYSNVMRSYTEILVFTLQQLTSTERVLKSMKIADGQCEDNFWRNGRLVTAELLHLSLQKAGLPDAHKFVNAKVIPQARFTRKNLINLMNEMSTRKGSKLKTAWAKVPHDIKDLIANPGQYLGNAVQNAENEVLKSFQRNL